MRLRLLLLGLGLAASHVLVAEEVALESLQVGHWLSVRGGLADGETFLAERAELVDAQRFDELIGTAEPTSNPGASFSLLGQQVVLDEQTRYDEAPPQSWPGGRYRVEGVHRGERDFVAREISARGEGRARIVGRIESLRQNAGAVEARVMDYWIRFVPGTTLDTEKPLDQYAVELDRFGSELANRDEDDLFGEGLRIGENAVFQNQIELRVLDEDNFDLDDGDAENRVDREASVRARLLWAPQPRLFATAELKYRQRWRNDAEDGSSTDDEIRLGETYVRWRNIGDSALDLVVGRQDFDDPREWIYDQDLDAVRLIVSRPNFKAEFSTSTTLSHGDERDEGASNLMAYFSNTSDDLHVAGYLVYRDIEVVTAAREKPLHIGARVVGEWGRRAEGWLDVATLRGTRAGRDLAGWALDLGSTWEFDLGIPVYFTAGYAYGSGSNPADDEDREFRQTGFNDNNAKFGGVTSFRYYGELLQPDLANMHIKTLGIGFRPASRASLDLVWHSYRQDELSTTIFDAQLDQAPTGLHEDLGQELDVVVGVRRSESWDLELIAGYFEPGPAFDDRDEAFFAKVQFRYRH